jgi:hypothetical protein
LLSPFFHPSSFILHPFLPLIPSILNFNFYRWANFALNYVLYIFEAHLRHDASIHFMNSCCI